VISRNTSIIFQDKKISLEFLLHCLNNSYDGILLSDLSGRIFYANEAVARISGTPLDEIVGLTPKEMEENGTIVSQSTKILQNDPLTMSQKLRNGKEVFITSKPVLNEYGITICYLANYRDLSNLNELHKQHYLKLNIDYSELQELRTRFIQTDDWIVNSHIMKKTKEKVLKVSMTEATVLIIGESGVGKEVIAKTIHRMSNRAKFPYIQINCGAIPESLMEAELFGYEKGAFTGANQKKLGLLEVANQGTILLDEIGELALHLQVKLLRVIQTSEITRVGGTKPIKLNVRFLSATNRDLKQMVESGQFREDLFYRLNVIPIEIPPLRQRRDDIIPLAYYFLKKINKKYDSIKSFSSEFSQILEEYDWPGNVRQLENLIERLVIMAEGAIIGVENLPREMYAIPKSKTTKREVTRIKEAVQSLERELIEIALSQNSSIREAAKELGINHSTLIRKIRKLGLTNISGA
jgi:PAS domain S-box-containing protein